MATAPPLLSIEEYLHTSYKPDVHYVDGEIEERNVGEYDHAKIQTIIAVLFSQHEDEWHTDAVVEQRIRIGSNRVRVCDVAVLRQDTPYQPVATVPPLICIEVKSPEDRHPRIEQVLGDYFGMGVPNIWFIDPMQRKAYTYDGAKLIPQDEYLSVPETSILISVSELFKLLEKAISRRGL